VSEYCEESAVILEDVRSTGTSKEKLTSSSLIPSGFRNCGREIAKKKAGYIRCKGTRGKGDLSFFGKIVTKELQKTSWEKKNPRD